MLYVLLVLFGLVNVLTSIYVDGTTRLSIVDMASVMKAQTSKTNSDINTLHEIFREEDSNQSSTISSADLDCLLENPEVQRIMRQLGHTVSVALGLYKLLDIDDQGKVPTDEFVSCLIRLEGTVGSDIPTHLYERKRLFKKLNLLMHCVEDGLN